MATLDQLKTHIEKAKTGLSEATKTSEDVKTNIVARQKRKKVKRLERKLAKITATEKMAEEKKKPKKERKSATAG